MKRYYILISLIISCTFAIAAKDETTEDIGFNYPTIPNELVIPEERGKYLVEHYWDMTDFTDTVKCMDERFTGQAFSNFTTLFAVADSVSIAKGMDNMISRAAICRKSYEFLMETAENYLSDPVSPVYNTEYYIAFLEAYLRQPSLNDTERIRPNFRLESAKHNRPGSKATDFNFTARDGSESTISQFSTKSPKTLMVIYDPTCETCSATIEALSKDEGINWMISKNMLQVIAIYGGDDRYEWKQTAGKYPSNWTIAIGTDSAIDCDGLYPVMEYPAMYMLDNNGTVLLKEATLPQIMRAL